MIMIIFPVGFTIIDGINFIKASLRVLTGKPKSSGYFISLFGLNLLIVHHFSLKHPFLDSDNRHYGQKFYKYIISTNKKYLFVPIYSICMLFLGSIMKKRAILSCLIICASATLVLTPLFELRYFLIPWALMSIEIKQKEEN